MPHGKRWKITFFLLNEATGESFSMVFENDFDHDVATLIAEKTVSICNLLRMSPRVDDVVVNMMCHTCGFESQDSFVSSCNCNNSVHGDGYGYVHGYGDGYGHGYGHVHSYGDGYGYVQNKEQHNEDHPN